jgi:hypothetical protein
MAIKTSKSTNIKLGLTAFILTLSPLLSGCASKAADAARIMRQNTATSAVATQTANAWTPTSTGTSAPASTITITSTLGPTYTLTPATPSATAAVTNTIEPQYDLCRNLNIRLPGYRFDWVNKTGQEDYGDMRDDLWGRLNKTYGLSPTREKINYAQINVAQKTVDVDIQYDNGAHELLTLSGYTQNQINSLIYQTKGPSYENLVLDTSQDQSASSILQQFLTEDAITDIYRVNTRLTAAERQDLVKNLENILADSKEVILTSKDHIIGISGYEYDIMLKGNIFDRLQAALGIYANCGY